MHQPKGRARQGMNRQRTFSMDQMLRKSHPCLALLNFQMTVLSALFCLKMYAYCRATPIARDPCSSQSQLIWDVQIALRLRGRTFLRLLVDRRILLRLGHFHLDILLRTFPSLRFGFFYWHSSLGRSGFRFLRLSFLFRGLCGCCWC